MWIVVDNFFSLNNFVILISVIATLSNNLSLIINKYLTSKPDLTQHMNSDFNNHLHEVNSCLNN